MKKATTDIISSLKGVVRLAELFCGPGGIGLGAKLANVDGWMTVYAHMNSMVVRRGARVTVGQKIGTIGQTGKVNKPQLHFEIRKGTKAYNPTNYLK